MTQIKIIHSNGLCPLKIFWLFWFISRKQIPWSKSLLVQFSKIIVRLPKSCEQKWWIYQPNWSTFLLLQKWDETPYEVFDFRSIIGCFKSCVCLSNFLHCQRMSPGVSKLSVVCTIAWSQVFAVRSSGLVSASLSKIVFFLFLKWTHEGTWCQLPFRRHNLRMTEECPLHFTMPSF